jgi:peptide/nickel transport system substrate-binding protein
LRSAGGLAAALAVCVWAGLASAAEAPRRGGTFIMANTADPVTLNPTLTTTVQAIYVTSMVMNALVAHDLSLNPIPDLARSWTISDDGLTIRFDLVRNATWHDGKPFTSADVKFTFDEALIKYHPLGKTAYAAVESIQTPDPHTVVFRFKHSAPAFMNIIGAYAGTIIPKHLYEGTDLTKNPLNAQPVGTGPFRFKEWVKGSHIALERNPNYFKAGKPYLDRIVVKVVPDPGARMVAFEAGELDYLPYFGTPLHEVPRIQRMPDSEVTFAPGFSSIFMLWFNLRKAPLSDLRVRQAIAHAVDRQAILDKAAFGVGKLASGPIASGTKWAFHPNLPRYARDLARANRLLDEAGYRRGPDGTRFKISLLSDAAGVGPATGEIVREQLREVGIALELRPMEAAAFYDRMFVQWDYDMAFQEAATGPDPAIGVARLYITSNIRRVPFTNGTGYSNPEADDLFAQGAKEPSVAKRGAIYRKLQEILVRDLPMIWLWEQAYPVAYKKRFAEVVSSPYSNMDLHENTWMRQQ